jgi:Na+-translocating ferredoxin:NAD+ oxidoreductase RnfG subunit
MSSVVFVALVLGVLGLLVAIIRKGTSAEIEKATSQEARKVALDKLETLEKNALVEESTIRNKEAQEIKDAHEHETVVRSTIGFYPVRMRPKTDDDLN